MGRDNKQGRSHNSGRMAQTPKNQLIAPKQVKEETAEELLELEKAYKHKTKNASKPTL
ncbi:hypothetical protein M3603_07995 [Rummeliibacillus stabekisii]|uniref:hypothetical protein n=1 Tax=Rummeliibacillus TaxID=648802 RepID=UPI00168175FD|nr:MULTISPECIES: hypothetical protein [Rummeliibacillus]MCM3316619.1 hypothetical protein [Rummeliibacillus stabekisii]